MSMALGEGRPSFRERLQMKLSACRWSATSLSRRGHHKIDAHLASSSELGLATLLDCLASLLPEGADRVAVAPAHSERRRNEAATDQGSSWGGGNPSGSGLTVRSVPTGRHQPHKQATSEGLKPP